MFYFAIDMGIADLKPRFQRVFWDLNNTSARRINLPLNTLPLCPSVRVSFLLFCCCWVFFFFNLRYLPRIICVICIIKSCSQYVSE